MNAVSPPPEPPAWVGFSLNPHGDLRPERTPYPFQDYAVFLTLRESRFVIGAATGLGKTFMSYQVWKYVCARYPRARMIVLTTKSATLQFIGEHDAFYQTPTRAVAVHSRMSKLKRESYGQARQRAYAGFGSAGPDAVDVLVMNHSVFRSDNHAIVVALASLCRQGIPYVLVLDEATVVKNPETRMHRCVNEAARHSLKSILLTATMTKGKLEEIYGIMTSIDLGGAIAPNRDEFLRQFCVVSKDPDRPGEILIVGYRNLAEFARRIGPYSIVLRKADVADFLPPFVLKQMPVSHTQEQYDLIASIYSGKVDVERFAREAYDLSGEDLDLDLARSEANPIITVKRLTEQGHIKRALMDPRLVYKAGLSDYRPARYSPKTAAIVDFLRDECTGERVVFYSPSKAYLKLLAETIRHADGLEHFYRNPMLIHGDVSVPQREANRIEFQQGAERRLLGLTDAGLESLNLQAASIMIVTGLPKSGGDLIQLAGRLSRIGSQHSSLMMAYFLTADSQDMDEYSIMQRQMQISALVLGESEKGLLDQAHLRVKDLIGEGVSDDDYRNSSMACLMLMRRTRRAAVYAGKASKRMVEA